MALPSWTMLAFLLMAGSSSAEVNVNWLTRAVNAIRTEYRINEQFCLAANIPLNLNQNNLPEVFQNDRYTGNVDVTLADGDVYRGSSVVAAKPAGPVHAERQVLTNLQQLISNSQDKFLLIYSYLSPCGRKCTNLSNRRFNIIKDIQRNVLPNWREVAFVFTKVFDKPKFGSAPTKEDLITSLEQLGDSGLGLRNIFRCFKPINSEFQCYSCSSRGRVSDVCVDNNFQPGVGSSSQNRDRSSSSSIISRKRGRYRSESSSSIISRKRGRYQSENSSSRGRSSSGSRGRSRDRSSSGSRGRSRDRSSSGSRGRSRDRSSSGSRGRSSSGSRGRSRDRSSSGSRSRSRGGG